MKAIFYVLGGLFAFIGIVAMFTASIPVGLILVLVGVYLFYYAAHYKKSNKKKSNDVRPNEAVPSAPVPSAAPAPSGPVFSAPTIKKLYRYPSEVDGCALAYYYVFEFKPKDGVDVVKDVLGDSEKIVDVDVDGNLITLIHNGSVFGVIPDDNKAQMVSDFKKRGEPCNAILLADGKKVNLRFYKDKLKSLAKHENDVVKLRSFKGANKQEIIESLDADDELDFDEEDDKIIVEYIGDAIGRLPSSIEKRVFEEDEEIAAIFVDHIEESENDDGDDVFIPYVKVFWE